jgi:hypothetical protein
MCPLQSSADDQQALHAIDGEPRAGIPRAAGLWASVTIKDVISREPFCASVSDEALVDEEPACMPFPPAPGFEIPSRRCVDGSLSAPYSDVDCPRATPRHPSPLGGTGGCMESKARVLLDDGAARTPQAACHASHRWYTNRYCCRSKQGRRCRCTCLRCIGFLACSARRPQVSRPVAGAAWRS